jgi:MutS domain V
MSPLQSFYQEKQDLYTSHLRILQKKLTMIAVMRGVCFIAVAGCVYFLFGRFSYLLLIATLCLFTVFVILVNFFFRLKDKRALQDKLLWVNINESNIVKDMANQLEDGQAFLSPETYLDDLDIFGKRSLFHFLNRTTTVHGKQALAALLKSPLEHTSQIEKYQQAVRLLSQETDKRQLLTAHGLLKEEKEGNLFGLEDWLEAPTPLRRKKWVMIIRWVVMTYNILCLLLLIYNGNYRPLLAGVVAGWILTGLFARYISEQHVLLGRKHGILEQYMAILRLFNTIDPGKSELLGEVRQETGRAHDAIRQLARLSNFFDQSLNFLVAFILNNLFLYNLNCMVALEKWKETNKKFFPSWIEAVGSIELLNSLATYAFNHPHYVYPTAVEAPLFIEAEQLAHPLIPAGEAVANDFAIGQSQQLILVTGSNMSGKTTFLRAIGVNVLLAQCGAPVCAARFVFTPVHLLTSLRISDSLQEHTSYFMAELKKLQKIIHRLRSGVPCLVLIDEILRGTNSDDKTYGSEQFIRQLIRYQCLSLFATHDLSLGQLEQEMPAVVSNYCFESIIENGDLLFDYRLQKGIARNRNASFLMKKMEII